MRKFKKIENKLKEARFFAKKNQVVLCLETGIHYSTISRIECGYCQPTPDQKKKLAKALKVSVDWLFPEKEEKKK